MHYLDHSATTFVLPEAAHAACRVMTQQFGNPSSVHRMGIEAAGLLEDARAQAASLMNAAPMEITFTSCGTEASNTAIWGAAHRRGRGKHIITTAIEHAATLNACKRLEQEGFSVTYLAPDASGHISLSALREAIQPDRSAALYAGQQRGRHGSAAQGIRQAAEKALSGGAVPCGRGAGL